MRIDFNNDWLWSPEFAAEMTEPVFGGEDKMEQVRIPQDQVKDYILEKIAF